MTGLRTTCCSFFGWLQRLGLKSWRISVPFLLLLATTWFEVVTHLTTGLRAVSSWAGYSALVLGLKSWRVWKQYHSCCFLPQHDLKSWCILWQDHVLFLLGLATASRVEIVTHFKAALNLLLLATTWIKAVTHYKAVPFLLLLATTWFTWNRDAFYDGTTCCLFLLEILGLTHFKAAVFLLLLELKSQLPFKAVPVLLLLAATWLEIVTRFLAGLRDVPSWAG